MRRAFFVCAFLCAAIGRASGRWTSIRPIVLRVSLRGHWPRIRTLDFHTAVVLRVSVKNKKVVPETETTQVFVSLFLSLFLFLFYSLSFSFPHPTTNIYTLPAYCISPQAKCNTRSKG